MTIGNDNTGADGLSRHKNFSKSGSVTGSANETASPTTPGVERVAIHQPSNDDGWGRVWPAFADLQGGEEHTTPGLDRATISRPNNDDGWGRARPAFADLQGGGDLQTWTVATHIFREPTRPQEGGDARSAPVGPI